MHSKSRKNSPKRRWSASRVAYYALAAALPPVMLGIFLTFLVLKELMMPPAPEALPGSAPIPEIVTSSARPVALILLGGAGVQTTEVLAPAAVLGQSFEIVTAASHRGLVRSTAGLELLPHSRFKEAPRADILVLPSWIGEPTPEEVDEIRSRAASARVVLALGEGARLLASAGLLDGVRATSHPAGRHVLERSYPSVKWEWDRAAVADGKWVTSGGVYQSVAGAIEALKTAGDDKAASLASQALGWTPSAAPDPSEGEVRASDWIALVLHGGFAWGRTNAGIFVGEGTDELELAAAADPLPRTLSARTVILAGARKPYRSARGLWIVPNLGADKAPPLDALYVPRGKWKAAPAGANRLKASEVIAFPGGAPRAWDAVFDRLSQTEGAWIAGFAARMTRYPWDGTPSSAGRLPHLMLRALFISLCGLTLAWFLERRVQAKYGRR